MRDNLNWIRGNHALKFGGGARFEQDNDNLLGGARPLYVFSGLFNFANDTPVFEQINANPLTGARPTLSATFARKPITDSYRMTGRPPNLTVNLGVRWDTSRP